jgi:hypothetical protein
MRQKASARSTREPFPTGRVGRLAANLGQQDRAGVEGLSALPGSCGHALIRAGTGVSFAMAQDKIARLGMRGDRRRPGLRDILFRAG